MKAKLKTPESLASIKALEEVLIETNALLEVSKNLKF